jgi:lipopolysaccharide biosynthesis glycosyltransferase
MLRSNKRLKRLKACLSTIVTPDFMPGALVMIDSFLQYNKWFTGDILIFGEGLRNQDRKLLQSFPNVFFPEPDPELLPYIDRIIEERPEYERKRVVFYSLSLFNLTGYDKYIYIDSDAFFT